MAATRRMGLENSVSRTALMDGVETVMREDGYAALTARSVAERAGLKHQLVYYYFQTMDDLLLAAFRRRSDQMVERARQALASDRPLHMLWQLSSDSYEGALTVEYLALANHNDLIRREAIEFTARLRGLKDSAVAERLQAASPDPEAVTPLGMITALGYVACWLTGWFCSDRDALEGLGVKPDEKVAGFIHIGKVAKPSEDRPRPALSDIVTRF